MKISKSRVPIVPVVYNVLDLGSFIDGSGSKQIWRHSVFEFRPEPHFSEDLHRLIVWGFFNLRPQIYLSDHPVIGSLSPYSSDKVGALVNSVRTVREMVISCYANKKSWQEVKLENSDLAEVVDVVLGRWGRFIGNHYRG